MVEVLTDNDKARLAAQEKAIIKYFASWCGSCRLIKPKYNRLSEDARFEGIAFLDVDAENNPELRKMAGVTNLPYFAIFEKGVLKDGIATNKEEAIVELLNKL
jgi:thiol-disulfide isomerase/thioredoxin